MITGKLLVVDSTLNLRQIAPLWVTINDSYPQALGCTAEQL